MLFNSPYLDELVSCVVSGIGDDEDCLLDKGIHLGTALPDDDDWLLFTLRDGTEPAGAVLIRLQ